MKKILACLLTILILALALPALAEDSATITATGTATVTLAPDMATFTVGVSTQNASVADAQNENAQTMQAVLARLKELGITDEDLQTSDYSINPQYDYSSDTPVLAGYSVSNMVTITVRDMTKLSTLLDEAIAAGANQTYGVTFASSHADDAYDQALAAAAQDALRKAEVMAQSLGLETSKLLAISENQDSYYGLANSRLFSYDSSSATPVQSGTLSVSATVTAVVALQ